MVHLLWNTVLQIFISVEIVLSYDLAVAFLGIYPND